MEFGAPGSDDRVAIRVHRFLPPDEGDRVCRIGEAPVELVERARSLFALPEMGVGADQIEPVHAYQRFGRAWIDRRSQAAASSYWPVKK